MALRVCTICNPDPWVFILDLLALKEQWFNQKYQISVFLNTKVVCGKHKSNNVQALAFWLFIDNQAERRYLTKWVNGSKATCQKGESGAILHLAHFLRRKQFHIQRNS